MNWAWVIFAAALAIRLLHIWQIRRAPFFTVLMGDSRGYDAWGQRIAAGDWLGSDVFYQAPLYPYFLGTIYTFAGHDLLVVRICQVIIGALACALLGFAAFNLWSRQAGRIAGLGLALYAPAIFFDGLLQKTVLDVFLVCLALWQMSEILAHRGVDSARPPSGQATRGRPLRRWLFLGLTLGLLALTRENAMVFVAVILLWIVFRRHSPMPAVAAIRPLPAPTDDRATRARAAGMFLLGLVLVLFPVALRNNVVGGGFYVTTAQFGPNFYLGNNATADGTAQSLRVGRGSAEYERQDATELAEHAMGRRLTPGEVSQYWTDRALAFITSSPGAWLQLMIRKFALLWNATEMLDTESQESYAEWSAPIRFGAIVGHFGVLVPLALFGVFALWPERNRLWVFYAMIGAYAASVLLFFVYARYRFPLVPFLMLFAAAGIAAAPKVVRARKRMLPAVVTLMVATIVFTNWPVLSPALMRAITDHNLGAALQSDGRIDEAVAHYQRALAVKPDHAPSLNNLGTALAAKGDVSDAIEYYERALTIEPTYSSAHYNLANALLQRGKPDAAREHFEQALQGSPGSADVYNNLGIALLDERRYDEAIAQFQRALEFDPNSAKTYRNLGNVLASAGRTTEAIGALQKAVALDPRDGPSRYDLASMLIEAGQPSEAVEELRRALELMPTSVDVLNNLGIALASVGKLDEAIDIFERALTLQPGFGPARENLAAARQQQRSKPSRR